MDTGYYLSKFQNSLAGLDLDLFRQKSLDLKVGIWLDSVVLKIQNPAWLNQDSSARPFSESIFFSVWVSDEPIRESKIYYNIHALKMRELKGYKIKSRDFAQAFRERFKAHQSNWPNVSVNYGPLTLMEGWVVLDDSIEHQINTLALKFLDIAYIIDDLLNEAKK